jgi:hypothetical protein
MEKQIRKAHETFKYLSVDNNFESFMKEFLPYLQNNLQLIQVHGNKESFQYYSCGQPHDPRDPQWRQFQFMEKFCRKKRCDFQTVKWMIEERLFKKLICECEILTNRNDIRRKELKQVYGLDFGGLGRREVDIF